MTNGYRQALKKAMLLKLSVMWWWLNMSDPLVIAGRSFTSRFLLGTGKFKNKTDLKDQHSILGQ